MGAEFDAIIEERTGTIGGKSSRRGQTSETLIRYDIIRRAIEDTQNTNVAYKQTNAEATGTAPKPAVPVQNKTPSFEYVDIKFGK